MKPTVKQLKNGISVILSPQAGARSVTVFVFCRVGSRYEAKEINGASHFIEHLMFKGTKRRPSTQALSRELDQYGANYNAMTSKDYTGYYIKIDASHADAAVDLLHDMLFHSTYEAKEINRERGVIIEEINMYKDNPQYHIEDLLEETLFPNSTLGWMISGPKSVVQNISRRDLISFRDTYYVPSRLTIAVAGRVPTDILTLLNSTFGRVRAKEEQAARSFKPFSPPKQLKKPLTAEEKQTEQTQVGIAFYGYPWGHDDEPAAKLLSTMLGESMSSRLFIQVRERKGLCYAIHSIHQPLEDMGIFGIYAGLDRRRLRDAVETIMKEIRKIRRSGVTEDELRRAKDHLQGKLTLALEDSAFRTGWYGKRWMFLRDIKTPEERFRALRAVTTQDIARVARDLFRGNLMASAVIGPRVGKGTLEQIFKLE